jgi:hypothetical protein
MLTSYVPLGLWALSSTDGNPPNTSPAEKRSQTKPNQIQFSLLPFLSGNFNKKFYTTLIHLDFKISKRVPTIPCTAT